MASAPVLYSASYPIKTLKHQPSSHSLSCGICKRKVENSTRGVIDSCDHYFCFECIDGWCETTSTKCPMCNRRITTVRRQTRINSRGIRPRVWLCHNCTKTLLDLCQNGNSHVQVESSQESNQKRKASEINFPSQLHSSFSQSCQQLGAENDSDRNSNDTDKAWEMMKIAKSMQKNSERSSSVHQPSKQATKTSSSSSIHIAKRQRPGTSDLPSKMKKAENHIFPKSIGQKQTGDPCETRPPPTCSQRLRNDVNTKRHIQSTDTSSSLHILKRKQPDSTDLESELKKHSSFVSVIKENHGLPNSKRQKQNKAMTYFYEGCPPICSQGLRKDDNTKREIQALVKCNVKLLSGDKQLESDMFKEVARLATRAILAACGLEHRKFGIQLCPSSVVCSHTEQTQQLRKFSLMPNSCQECFHTFVNNVVQSIMFKKVDHARVR